MGERVRPTAVSVIGWAWIGLGLWMTSAGGMGLAVYTLQGSAPFFSPPLEWVWPAGLGFQLAAGTAGVVLGGGLLRVKRWAYLGIQVLMGLVLLYMSAVGSAMLWLASDAFTQGVAFTAAGIVGVGLFTMVALGVPIIIMLRALRQTAVRESFQTPV